MIVATGCYDMPVALPGWTLPGVMTAGAVQAFMKSQQVVPGERFVFAGSHPLQLVVAAQAVAAGATVEAVLFAQPRSSALALLGHLPTVIAHAPKFALAAEALRKLWAAGVPVRFGRTIAEVMGAGRVEAVRVASVVNGTPGTGSEEIACDRAAFCFGFLPQSDLPRAAGAAFEWATPTGGWRVTHDPWMRTSVSDLYVAGEVTGVAGAQVSLLEGRLAGLGLVRDAGVLSAAEADRLAKPVRAALAHEGRFSDLLRTLAAPGDLICRLPRPDTLICRCEDVAQSAVLPLAAGLGANAAKLISRAGMGFCQGRTCEHAIVRTAAGAEGRTPQPRDAFAARFPARPALIGAIVDTAFAKNATRSDAGPD